MTAGGISISSSSMRGWMGWAAVGRIYKGPADGDVDSYAGPAGWVSSLIRSSPVVIPCRASFFRFALLSWPLFFSAFEF